MADADPLLGVRHLVPQLEDPAEKLELLGVSERAARRHGRAPAADQGLDGVVRRVPVVRLLDLGPARRDKAWIVPQRRGEPGVQPGVVARQQVVDHRLPDQAVPERVPVRVGDQDVRSHRGPQRAGQLVVVQAGGRGEQAVPHALPACAGRPQHLLGLLGQPPHRGQQQLAQGLGQHRERAAIAVAQQLLDEQRVAVGTRIHPVGERRLGLAAQDPGHQLVGVQPVQPGQVHPLHPGEPGELGQQRPQRVGAVHLVGAVGDDDQHAVQHLLAADEEGQQVSAGTVGPVRVLDQQDHRPVIGQALQQREHLLEQPDPGHDVSEVAVRRTELRQQPGEVMGNPAGQQRGHPVGAEVADEFPQHGGERRERQAVGAEFHAAAGQYPRPGRAGPRRELAHQARLSDARLAAEQHDRGAAVPGRAEGGLEHRKLIGAPHKDGAGCTRGHVLSMPGRGVAPGRR